MFKNNLFPKPILIKSGNIYHWHQAAGGVRLTAIGY